MTTIRRILLLVYVKFNITHELIFDVTRYYVGIARILLENRPHSDAVMYALTLAAGT